MVGIPIRITSSVKGLKISAETAGIKKYKSIIKEKNLKYDKIILWSKPKSNSIEVLISKTLIDAVVSHDQFLLINNVREG